MTLEEAIQQLITLGEKDPLTIARIIKKRNDPEWLAAELVSQDIVIVAGIARERLSGQRRSATIALRPGDEASTAELKLKSFWIPDSSGGTWVPAKDVTPDDLRARASWYEIIAAASLRYASWCREVADCMEAQGAKTLGKFKGALPPLSAGELPEAA